MPPLRDRAIAYFRDLQDRIVAPIEEIDGRRFRRTPGQREGGGGGRSRVLAEGGVFEKAGVNFSDVHGEMSEDFARQVPGEGRSLHRLRRLARAAPAQPDGADRPRQLPLPDQGRQAVVRRRGRPDAVLPLPRGRGPLPPRLAEGLRGPRRCRRLRAAQAWCDDYFYLPHRNEARGVGGIFFDYLEGDLERTFDFVRDAGDAFLDAYLPIVRRRIDEPYTEAQKEFQEYRRGRYVEFNLVYDRGTLFGLKTGGRIESILMSLPREGALVVRLQGRAGVARGGADRLLAEAARLGERNSGLTTEAQRAHRNTTEERENYSRSPCLSLCPL